MTGAGQGGTDKRHRTAAPLTRTPSGRRNPQKRRPWTLLGQPGGPPEKNVEGRRAKFSTPAVMVPWFCGVSSLGSVV